MRLAALLVFWCGFAVAGDRVSVVFDQIGLPDLVRVVYGEIAHEPYILTHEAINARDTVSLTLRGLDRAQIVGQVEELLKASGYVAETRGGVVWIQKRKDPAIVDEVVVYHPRYRAARYLADVVQSITGAKSVMSRSLRSQGPHSGSPEGDSQLSQASRIGQQQQAARQSSPSSAEGQIDRSEVDQIAFTVAPKDRQRVEKLLADLDTPPGEIVLKAAVYEVGTDRREGSALKLAASIFSNRVTGSVAGTLFDGVSLGISMGGIDAVVSALDSDSRFRSLSRPQLRVRNGAQARFSVGQDVPVLGNAQVDRNGNPVQAIEYKQSGVILTAIPEIRQEVIELTLKQELSNFVVTKTGVNGSPTLIKRAVDTQLGLVPGEVVVLAGLQEDQDDRSESRLPMLGWPMGRDGTTHQTEILVFLEVMRL